MLEQQTWVTLLGMAGFVLALAGYLHTIKRDLRAELNGEIAACRTELKGDIAELRREMKSEFAKVDGRLTTLEQRTYDLSTRLPARPA